MKALFTFLTSIVLLTSCNKNIYGFYDSSYNRDKSAYFSINLKQDKTVEKDEIHTIRIFSTGIWNKVERRIYCFFDSTEIGFPRDTISFKIIGKKLFPIKNGVINKNFYFKKNRQMK